MLTARLALASPRPIAGPVAERLVGAVGAISPAEPAPVPADLPFHAVAYALRLDPSALAASRRDVRTRAHELGVDAALVPGSLADAPPGLVVLDVDSTLITAEVIELIADRAGTRAEVAAVTGRAMRGELDFAASLRERVATLAGLPAGVLDEMRDEVVLSPGARTLVDGVHASGGRVGLVSGGFAEIVRPLAASLGIDDDLVAANRLEVRDGRLTGRTSGPVVDRAAKARHLTAYAARLGVPLDATVAIGDGANDLDMLAAAGLGIAYCAKPITRDAADAAISFPRLDAAWAFVGR